MPRYYHYTTEENIERILREGLKPGIEVGQQTGYRGKVCDNRYVYLAKGVEVFRSGPFKGLVGKPGTGLLSVDIPEEHTLERDLDVYVIITTQGILASFEFMRIMGALGVTDIPDCRDIISQDHQRTYDLLTKKIESGDDQAKGLLLMLVATDEQAVKTLLGRATQEKWDEVLGFYRTQVSIPLTSPYKIERYYPTALTAASQR
jgi:hypothetical protein